MRLHLFLAAALLLGTPAVAQQSVSLTDIKVDYAALDGQEVSVSVVLTAFGSEMATLTDPMVQLDTSGVTAQIDRLPREQRVFVVENCGLGGCRVRVVGVVRDTFMGPMMELTSVDIRNSSAVVPQLPKAPARSVLPAATGDQFEYTDENGQRLLAEPPPALVLPPMGAGRSAELQKRLDAARRGNPEAFAYYDQHRGPEIEMKCPIVCREFMD